MKGSPMKRNFGISTSPIKYTGIFDSRGNRISAEDALKLEEKGESTTYTEQDAVDRAKAKQSEAATDAEKKLWQKEIDAQKETIKSRSENPQRLLGGGTKGEKYAGYAKWDKKLQDMVKSGEYDTLSKEEKIELEKKAGRSEGGRKGGFYTPSESKTVDFPTTGQIRQTESNIGDLREMGIIE